MRRKSLKPSGSSNGIRVLIPLFFWALAALLLADIPGLHAEQAPGRTMAQQAVQPKAGDITVDHAKLDLLRQEFRSGKDVTRACLSCHTEADHQFRDTLHWTWLADKSAPGEKLGKAGDSVNNFCISTNTMQDPKCNSCHTGWDGKNGAVNCLTCHGRKKLNFKEAFDDYVYFSQEKDAESLELAAEIQKEIQSAVQSVGPTSRSTCGACHFYGGGGDGVKHGDLDSSLALPSKQLDVHMGADGQNFRCSRCHTSTRHHIAGRVYTIPAATDRKSLLEDDTIAKITCESCHSAQPHKSNSKANDHTDKVACQSCHIPEVAKEVATKIWWDWSKAGRVKDGKPFKEEGPFGRESYMSIKGEMKWAKNLKPEYYWYDGTMHSLTVRDTIDPEETVPVAHPEGEPGDGVSRIYPFKIHRGKQPYDLQTQKLLAPLLSGGQGFWDTLDWPDALSKGMAHFDEPFSGEYGFAETTYAFPITHMVAPVNQTVACGECHTRENGRLANLDGFYMPGRDTSVLDTLGWLMVIGALGGTALHAAGRYLLNGRKPEK